MLGSKTLLFIVLSSLFKKFGKFNILKLESLVLYLPIIYFVGSTNGLYLKKIFLLILLLELSTIIPLNFEYPIFSVNVSNLYTLFKLIEL